MNVKYFFNTTCFLALLPLVAVSYTASAAGTESCATANENMNLMLTCPSGQVISEVDFASYGTPGGACGSFTTGSCNASKSMSVVSDACKGKNSCTLKADNNTFGDPCYGTAKKLAAQVACAMASDTNPAQTPVPIPVAPTMEASCATAVENNSLTLSCPSGQAIKGVDFASYGTPGGSCGSFTTGSCNASKSVSVVSDACKGKNSCTLKADNNTFGDPCYGTAKKLAAQVACGMASDTNPVPVPEPTPVPTPIANPNSDCPVELVGFGSMNTDGQNGTTGGGNATPTTVRTLSELKSAANDSQPRVIIVSGTIDTGSSAVSIASNKTIIGADKNATVKGGFNMNGVSNIIIRNLNIQGKRSGNSPADTIASRNSHHIWYDHLNVWDAGDGLLDITIQSSYQTVSWSKFWYSNANDGHRLASLNGSGGGSQPNDWGKLKITYHHNWWGDLVDQRMPRVMYGQGHQFNNYFNSPGNSYCIGVGSYGSVLIEDNYFKDVRNPHQFMYDVYMYAAATGNIYDNTTGTRDTGLGGSRDETGHTHMTAEAFTPPYRYTLDAAKDVPDIVKRCAGPQ